MLTKPAENEPAPAKPTKVEKATSGKTKAEDKWRSSLKVPSSQPINMSQALLRAFVLQGLPLPTDPYRDVADRAGASRDDVKAFATKAMGATSQDSGFRAMYQDGYKKETLVRIRDGMLEQFPGIKLFIGLGAALQTLEGQIALDVMYAGAKAGIVVLPVHDSFITTVENKEWLREQMTVHWANHVKEGAVTRIEQK